MYCIKPIVLKFKRLTPAANSTNGNTVIKPVPARVRLSPNPEKSPLSVPLPAIQNNHMIAKGKTNSVSQKRPTIGPTSSCLRISP